MFEEPNPFFSAAALELGELNDAVPGERLEGDAGVRTTNSFTARPPQRGPLPARPGRRSNAAKGPVVLKRTGLTEHYVPPWEVLQAAEARQKVPDRRLSRVPRSGEQLRRAR